MAVSVGGRKSQEKITAKRLQNKYVVSFFFSNQLYGIFCLFSTSLEKYTGPCLSSSSPCIKVVQMAFLDASLNTRIVFVLDANVGKGNVDSEIVSGPSDFSATKLHMKQSSRDSKT